MKKKRPSFTILDDVTITRSKDAAIIKYHDSNVGTTHFTIGPQIQQMSDQEILDVFNENVIAMEQSKFDYVAIETPPGSPQIEFSDESNQWIPRGDVLRCIIDDGGSNDEAIISIDDHELSINEFGRLLTTYAGWGMRIIFVPDTDIMKEPPIEVREPEV